jgi:hypothetical protein
MEADNPMRDSAVFQGSLGQESVVGVIFNEQDDRQ